MRAAILSLGCVLALAGCATHSAPPAETVPPPPPATDATYSGWERFTLTGVVREEPEGRPLAGVIVRVQGSNTGTVTDGTGTYRIQGLEGGSYTVEALGAGFYPERREITFGSHAICTRCREASSDERVLDFWMRRADLLPGGTGTREVPPLSRQRKSQVWDTYVPPGRTRRADCHNSSVFPLRGVHGSRYASGRRNGKLPERMKRTKSLSTNIIKRSTNRATLRLSEHCGIDS